MAIECLKNEMVVWNERWNKTKCSSSKSQETAWINGIAKYQAILAKLSILKETKWHSADSKIFIRRIESGYLALCREKLAKISWSTKWNSSSPAPWDVAIDARRILFSRWIMNRIGIMANVLTVANWCKCIHAQKSRRNCSHHVITKIAFNGKTPNIFPNGGIKRTIEHTTSELNLELSLSVSLFRFHSVCCVLKNACAGACVSLCKHY